MKALRPTIFWIHLAIGCLAGLVILAMSVSGVLLAFERQINAWADAPAVVQGPAGAAAQKPLDSLLATLETSGQGAPSGLVLHNSANAPVEAQYGRERTLYLNPWTAEIVGHPSERTRAFFSAVELYHRSLGLGMKNAFGRGLTGAANLAFLFMLVSGIYLWFPKVFNRASFQMRIAFRRRLQGRAREWNWHHVFGLWAVVPLLFIVATGVVMSYPWASNLLYKATGTQPPTVNVRGDYGPSAAVGADREAAHAANQATRVARQADSARYRALDDLAQIAKLQMPSWKSIVITVPRPNDHTLNVSIDRSVGGQPEKAAQLVINRESGHIDAIHTFSDKNAGRKLRTWARFTHTGEEFGVIGELIAALACIAAVMLVWTGLAMTIRRAIALYQR